MIKFTRFMLILFIVIFSILSLITIIFAFVLYRYSGSHIDVSVTDALSSHNETAFYCIDRSCKDNNIYNYKRIETATLSSGIKYEYVQFNEIPPHLINAIISIEDKRFFNHSGVDHKRSVKAAANFLLFHDSSYGGSTITQQLVKNITGNNKKNVDRKIFEAFSAMDIEKRFDKTEILEMYLNIINLSHGCRGIGAAALYYFSKQTCDLTLSESATIAAIISNPSKLDPQKHPNENMKKRNIILGCMLKQGYITQAEFNSVINEPAILKINSADNKDQINSWYIDTVIEDVINDYSKKYEISKQNAAVLLYNGGYRIYTAIDEQLQSIVDNFFIEIDNFPTDSEGKRPNSSMIIIDPNSGDVLAIAGNIGEKKANRIQNLATMTKRPSGSAIKPLSVYAPALEQGLINWSTIIEDSPILNENTGIAWPTNSNKKYIGNVNIKYAIANSLNTVSVKVLHMLGNETSFDFLTNKLSFTSLDKRLDMGDSSLGLGQSSYGVTLRELTSAYSIFQQGISYKTRTYYKVTDSNGRIILDNSPEQKNVISSETATIMTKLLQTVITEGTACGYIDLKDVEVAGKTGTTQYSYDKYFIGYTPDLLAGVWQGYEYPKTIDCFEGNYSICIWNDIMKQIYMNTDYAQKKNKEFFISKNINKYSYNVKNGAPPNKYDDKTIIEEGWFDIKKWSTP